MPAPSNHLDAPLPADPAAWVIEMFYDGDCPLCRREVAWLQRRDVSGKIRFTNIAAAEFSPEAVGVSREELMGQMHGRLPDGGWVKGVEVFRRVYGALGHTWLAALSRWPGVAQVLDFGYRQFARRRLWLTGRCGDTCSRDSRS